MKEPASAKVDTQTQPLLQTVNHVDEPHPNLLNINGYHGQDPPDGVIDDGRGLEGTARVYIGTYTRSTRPVIDLTVVKCSVIFPPLPE